MILFDKLGIYLNKDKTPIKVLFYENTPAGTIWSLPFLKKRTIIQPLSIIGSLTAGFQETSQLKETTRPNEAKIGVNGKHEPVYFYLRLIIFQ